MVNRDADNQLLAEIQGFVAEHSDVSVNRFKSGITDWGSEWQGVSPEFLPAADLLPSTLSLTIDRTLGLTTAFSKHRGSRKWEQSYTRSDNLVGDDMLVGYGFAEVIGKNGPFVSEKVRSGIGIWGPDIVYPAHQHVAEEVYVALAGSAEFSLEGDAPRMVGPGEAVYVKSNRMHGFRTIDQPLVVFYIWQAGDLRQKSNFAEPGVSRS
ncbi:MAG: dimethylsulfonioproprionate lyase family protein [Pseudomonadota bacterium]